MRTAEDFDKFYEKPDPWRISRATVRDSNLLRRLREQISGRSVLELGCGEGHLTEHVFSSAKSITGIDISSVAIERARARNLKNARFTRSDFLNFPFNGYDLISAIECVYYLTPEEQVAFLQKVCEQHSGKMLVLSAPIIGWSDQNHYFTHKRLLRLFNAFGFDLIGFYNLSVYWRPLPTRFIANLAKLPFCYFLVDALPTSMIYQRLFIVRTPYATRKM